MPDARFYCWEQRCFTALMHRVSLSVVNRMPAHIALRYTDRQSQHSLKKNQKQITRHHIYIRIPIYFTGFGWNFSAMHHKYRSFKHALSVVLTSSGWLLHSTFARFLQTRLFSAKATLVTDDKAIKAKIIFLNLFFLSMVIIKITHRIPDKASYFLLSNRNKQHWTLWNHYHAAQCTVFRHDQHTVVWFLWQ